MEINEQALKDKRKTQNICFGVLNTYPGLRVTHSQLQILLKSSPPAFGKVSDPHDEINERFWTGDQTEGWR